VTTDHGDHHDSEFAGSLLGQSAAVPEQAPASPPQRRSDRHRRSRRRRRRVIPVIAVVVVAVLAVAGYVVVHNVVDGLGTKDYKGAGTGAVTVQIKTGDDATAIGQTLKANGVVASTQAFIDAAKDSGKSNQFQAGYFKLHKEMSGKDAVALLLDPTSRISTKVTIPEGVIYTQVLALLSQKLNIPLAQLTAAAKDIGNLGIPAGYAVKDNSPEGFLFPSTYDFDPDVTAASALQELTAQYTDEATSLNFATGAKTVGQTPYGALIVASLVEAEVRFDEDRAKVARVAYNRLTSDDKTLGFDTTSAYEARIKGEDPTQINYNIDTPFNSRINPGLPPTPIGNPGEKSLSAAIHPATGDWKWFVSIDAAGHLGFFDNYDAFLAAKDKCVANKWGCI
jgi:UPF0755 protein